MSRRLVGTFWLAAGIGLALRVWCARVVQTPAAATSRYDVAIKQLFWYEQAWWLLALAAVLGLLGVAYLVLAELRGDDRLGQPKHTTQARQP